MNQEERKTAIRRMRVLVVAACILMLLYGLRLIFLQLVNGDDFKSQATNTTDYKFTVTAARGDIVDSRGERIATSVTGYNVVLNKLLMGDEDLDGMLQKIVELLRANGESWNDTLLISQPDAAGNYTFTAEEGSTRDQKALAAMKDNLGLQQYATANDVMEKLVEDYNLASYPLSWQRTLGGIHYEMQLQAFSNVNNFIMAENVSEATVATIKEHSLSLPGVEIVETSTRSYEQSTVLPHVLGRVGKITAEKWKVTDENGQTTYPLRDKGYNMNDVIGISGLESAYEDELRGKDGVETITRNSDGVIVSTAMTTVPEPGHTVQLTVNSDFQKAVEQALGRVDVLVSNAGIAQQKLFTDITPEEWQRMLNVNLTGAFNLCQLALPGMIRRKAGRILTVSSMWGQTGGSCEVHYSAAKAGLIGLTKALAKEEGPSGITVNCVAPGVIDTDMMASFTAEDKAALAEETPVGRLGTAEEVAKLLLYLAGEDAGYITGQVFGVNGGLVI